MARLQDIRPSFTALAWPDKVKFMEVYRTKRYNDLNTIQEFDLRNNKKTKSTKTREPREKAVKQPLKKQLATLSPAELALLKQLGLG